MPTAADLVRSAQAGETSAFAELVRLYERAAIVTAVAVLADFHAAQDAAQDGFVIAYRKLGELRDADAFGPWLLQIVRRRAAELRDKRRHEPSEQAETLVAPTSEAGWIAQYDDVVQHVARLPEHERCVVVMRYVDGHSVAEIARLSGKPLGTVTKQLSRAIERLKSWLVEINTSR